MSTFFVFCAGASASGKTTFSKMLSDALNEEGISTKIIPVDYYYKPRIKGTPELSNFDVPEAFDLDLLYQNVQDIRKQKPVDLPQFCFKIKDRLAETQRFDPKTAKVVIIEGIHALYDVNSYKIPAHQKYTVFVETDSYLSYLSRRIIRDIPPSSEGGRSTPAALTRQRELDSGVRDAFFEHIATVKSLAECVIANNNITDLTAALKEAVDTIMTRLELPSSEFKYSVSKLVSFFNYDAASSSHSKQAIEITEREDSVKDLIIKFGGR